MPFNKHIMRLLPGTRMHSRVLMALALEDSTTVYECCLGLSRLPFMGSIATCSDSPVIKFRITFLCQMSSIYIILNLEMLFICKNNH